ncbi:MAG: hypothetical protein ABIJ27_05880 [Candidatus Omnitrophota bacterium]
MKNSIFFTLSVFFLALCLVSAPSPVFAQPRPAVTSGSPPSKAPGGFQDERMRSGGFKVIFGVVENIDSSDPANLKIRVRSDVDGKAYDLGLSPWTNITKVTDLSELKNGDTVRVMSKKFDGKDVAMTVVFGNVKQVSRPSRLRLPGTKRAE